MSKALLAPPDGWAVVEPQIYRAASIAQPHLPFLKLAGIRTVVNMSTTTLSLAAACVACGMQVYQPCATVVARDQSQDDQRSPVSDEIAKDALEFILSEDHHPLVLTGPYRGSSGLEVAALVGCLRRVQRWALSSILSEFRLFVPSAPIYDVSRQFVERFDVSLVTLPSRPPAWLQSEQDLWFEECSSEGRVESTAKAATVKHAGSAAALSESDIADRARFHYNTRGHVPLLSARVSADDLIAQLKGTAGKKDDDD